MSTQPSQSLLQLNIGFIVHQANGFRRDFSFELSEIELSDSFIIKNLIGIAEVSRTTEGLLVQVEGKAGMDSECVYCLKPFEQPLHLDFVEMYTFQSHADENTELVLPDDLHINLKPLIREYFQLDIPINPACKSDCKGLCSICGNNLNTSDCQHEEEDGDPRFSVLKTLLDEDTPSTS